LQRARDRRRSALQGPRHGGGGAASGPRPQRRDRRRAGEDEQDAGQGGAPRTAARRRHRRHPGRARVRLVRCPPLAGRQDHRLRGKFMTTERPRRARRSQLSTPGSSEKMMQKAAASAADHVFLDLEDAVAPNQKVGARKKIVEALNTLDWGKKVRCVRINDLTTQWAYEDIIEVVEGARENLDTI